MEESELIKNSINGDLSAFQQLITIYSPLVGRFAFQLGHSRDKVDDIIQEVFIRAFRFIHQINGVRFSSWLYKITLNVSRDMYRQAIREEKKVKTLNHHYKINDKQPYVEESIIKNEQSLQLHNAIQKLPESYKILIVLFYFHDKTYVEIAEILNISLSSVKTRLHRAKQKLKVILLEMEENREYG